MSTCDGETDWTCWLHEVKEKLLAAQASNDWEAVSAVDYVWQEQLAQMPDYHSLPIEEVEAIHHAFEELDHVYQGLMEACNKELQHNKLTIQKMQLGKKAVNAYLDHR